MTPKVELNEEPPKEVLIENELTKFDVVKKLTIIGRGECGKTSIVNSLMDKGFGKEFIATPIENEIYEFKMKNKEFQLKIFDTSGQEEYSRFRTLTLPMSDYVIICYSVEDQKSFSEVGDTLIHMIKQRAPENVRILVCATKVDLRNESSISPEEGRILSKEVGALGYFECSAMSGEGIKDMFEFIKLDMYKQAYPRADNLFTRLFFCCGGE